MTHATAEQAPADTTVPAQTPTDLASVLYGSTDPKPVDPPSSEEADTQETNPEPESTSTPDTEAKADETASTSSPGDEPKPDASKGNEDPIAKELREQRAANRRLGRERDERDAQITSLRQEMQELRAKLDGTYEEPPKPTPEQIEEAARFQARVESSIERAVTIWPEEVVKKRASGDGSEFTQMVSEESQGGKLPSESLIRVRKSKQPAIEAMYVVGERDFREKYGSDPFQWEAKIAAKVEAELRPKITNELKKTMTAQPTGAPVPSIGEGRSARRSDSTKPKDLVDLLYGGTEAGKA